MVRLNQGIAILFITIGVVALIETLVMGGRGQVGYLAAAVFVALGVLRWRAIPPPQ